MIYNNNTIQFAALFGGLNSPNVTCAAAASALSKCGLVVNCTAPRSALKTESLAAATEPTLSVPDAQEASTVPMDATAPMTTHETPTTAVVHATASGDDGH